VSVTHRGAGRTDKPDAPYTIPMMANDTDALMEIAGMTYATVLGVSMGGRIALELALEHPERVARLILHGTRDRIVPLPEAEKMRRGIAGSQMVTFGGGHLFFLVRERTPFLDSVAAALSPRSSLPAS
jgi:pimeloyl-ACP methyl ester carboxylesterase